MSSFMITLTRNQLRVLAYLADKSNWYRRPTYRQIGSDLDISSPKGVWEVIEALRAKGMIDQDWQLTSTPPLQPLKFDLSGTSYLA